MILACLQLASVLCVAELVKYLSRTIRSQAAFYLGLPNLPCFHDSNPVTKSRAWRPYLSQMTPLGMLCMKREGQLSYLHVGCSNFYGKLGACIS